jgi:Family of unknown function (DUF6084)
VPDLNFSVDRAEPLPHSAAPLLIFKLRISEAGAEEEAIPIPAVALRCQIRIEPTRRRYVPPERERLLDLFGEPERWGQTLHSMLWTHTSIVVPQFTSSTTVDLPVPCTFDFNVAATKYFYALEDGEVPLCLLFSGTIFYVTDEGLLQVSQISWEKEASYRLPVQVWKDMMDLYYPNSAWLRLHRDVFDRLYQYKSQHGLPTWEQALENLLDMSEERVQP